MSDWQFRAELYQRYSHSLKVLAISLVALFLLLLLTLPFPIQQKYRLGIVLAITVGYLLVFFWAIPSRWGYRRWIGVFNTVVLITLISGAYAFLYEFSSAPLTIYLFVIFFSGFFIGKGVSYLAAVISLLGIIAVDNFHSQATLQQATTQGIYFLLFLITAHVGNILGNFLVAYTTEHKQKNQELSLLLEAGSIVIASLDLNQTIPKLVQKLIEFLPACSARIDLLEGERLISFGIAKHCPLAENRGAVLEFSAWSNLPWLQWAWKTQRGLKIQRQPIELTPHVTEFNQFFSADALTAWVIPLIVSDCVIGFLSIGEESKPNHAPISQVKAEFLETLANQIAIAVENARLHLQEQKKAKRLEILNRIASVIGSTIEMESLLQELYHLLQQVIPADTYYVGLVNHAERLIELIFFLDGEERYEGVKIPLDQGFAGYVVSQSKPLLVHHVAEELETLPVKPFLIGKDQMSASWLGVPFGKQDHVQGILAVASYAVNAFDEEDLQLLMNVAQQTALALDNARHHLEVEEKARRDSLTGVYNHGSFLAALEQAVEKSFVTNQPLSLIMLDIDYFKEYNDRYGHPIGDEALRLVVQAIQKQVKSRDVLGRWGGEEFGLILENASLENAVQVAQRIRIGLSRTRLTSSRGSPLVPPTISQGIASLPLHAKSAEELVDKADQALYLAKNAGRDQIFVFGSEVSIQ